MKVETYYLPYDEVLTLYTDDGDLVEQVFMSDYPSPYNTLHH